MSSTEAEPVAKSNVLERTVTGAIAGLVIGFLVEPLCFGAGRSVTDGIRWPIVGSSCGFMLGACCGLMLGRVRITSVTRHVVLGGLFGSIAGLLLGAFPFAIVVTRFETGVGEPLYGKMFATARFVGIVFGVPIGALSGSVAGLVYSLRWRKQSVPATDFGQT